MHTLYSYINLGQAYIIIILVSRFLFTTIIIAKVILLQRDLFKLWFLILNNQIQFSNVEVDRPDTISYVPYSYF